MAINIPIISSFDSKGIDKAIRDFKKLEGGSQKAAFGLLNTDAAMRRGVAAFAKFSAIGAGVVGVIGNKLVSAAYDSQKVMKQTEAIIKATGGAAGVTAEQVAKMSERFANQVGVDDEVIQSSANLLLTFKQVQNQVGKNNDIFNRAIEASLDLGNVFGSTDAAAMQLGKALSDPEKGITALRRAGINFTESQRDQIKALVESGHVLEAQKMILAEVESQVGGTAAATATGFDKMKVALENVAERLGELLIPYVEKFANFMTTTVVPVLNTFAAVIGERGIGAGLEYLAGKIVGALWNMGAFGKTILTVVGAFTALRVATITYSGVMGALNVVTTLSDGALKGLIVRLGAAKVAMLAAGGVTALLTIAAVAYGIYAKKKSDATERTQEFAEALKLEGQAQTDALVKLYKSDKAFKENIDTLTKFNYNLQDFQKYLDSGTGGLVALEQAAGKYLDTGVRIDKIVTSGSDAITKQTVAFYNLRQEVPQLRNATDQQILEFLRLVDTMRTMRAESINTQTALGNVTNALGNTKTGGVTPLDAELQKLLEDLKKTSGESDKLGKTVKTAQEKFKEYVSALKGYGSDQKAYTESIKDTTKAKKKLEEATNKAAVAQARFDQIVRGYGAGSEQAKAAQEALEQAQRDQIRASNEAERSTFAVTEAEKELGDLRAKNTAQPLRIAELETMLVNAKSSLVGQTNAVTAAESKLAALRANSESKTADIRAAEDELDAAKDAQRETTTAMKDAEEELKDLRLSQSEMPQTIREAEMSLTEARLAETEQTIALRDANNEVAAAQKTLNEVINGATTESQTYKDALQELNDAKNDEAEAAQNVADAIDKEAEAKLRLAEAERELKKARGETTAAQERTAQKQTGITDPSVKRKQFLDSVNKELGTKFKTIRAYIDAGKSATSKANRKAKYNQFARDNNIPELAKGGLVMSPTLALIGERGPEAVIPLNREMPSSGDTYNITINSKIADETLPDLLVAELRKFNRRSGAINIQVS